MSDENRLAGNQRIPMLREIVEERKQKAVETLSAGYAKNKLPLEEYERLVEYINKIESERELAVVEKIVAEYRDPENDNRTDRRMESFNDEDDEIRNSDRFGFSGDQVNPAIFSARKYSGPIKSGSQFVSIFGSQQITIKKSNLSKRQTVLDIVAIFGETTIFVEPGIQVSNRVIPILGSCDTSGKVHKAARDGDRELIISGAALLGSIAVRLIKE